MKAPEDPLEQLRVLLLREERQQISELREHVLEVPQRVSDMAQTLPDALAAGHAQGRKLARALQAPVAECLRESVKQDPQPLADALFPVIGPAIRKSIAEALRGFTESLNRTVEHSLSPKGLGWRFEAARSGVPFAEVVLKHTLRYRVDEAFLIHRESGLLIEHVAQSDSEERDNDAVSAMLTAIQDFVRDAFHNQDEVQQVALGERLLWVLRGPQVMLACLIRGVPNAPVRDRLSEVLERIHAGYGPALADFRGDRKGLLGLSEELRECLVGEEQNAKPPAAASKKSSWLLPVVLLLIVAGIAAYVWQARQQQRIHQQAQALEASVRGLADRLNTQPGLVVAALEQRDGVWTLRGLRDPLATAPDEEIERAGLSDEQLRVIWVPYQSLDPGLVERRAAKQLRLPPGVRGRLQNGVLVLEGRAALGWIQSAQQSLVLPAGVDRIDTTAVQAWEQPRPATSP